MIEDVDGWISRRLNGQSVTPALRLMIIEAVDAGYGWFEATARRLEFARSLPNDRWEEITIWTGDTRAGRVGFRGAHHAIRTIDARTHTTSEALRWARTPREVE